MASLYKYFFISILFFLLSCSNKNEDVTKLSNYEIEINKWHKARIDRLKKENSWLNLVGLFWLKEGDNIIGSAETNDIVFPKNSPTKLGIVTKNDTSIIFKSLNESKVKFKGEIITSIRMKEDISGDPTILEVKTLRWFIIKRGDRYGIRLRDLEAKLFKNFKGIDRFPVNEKFNITTKFIPYSTPKKVLTPTIMGTFEENLSPGKINFKVNGKDFSLEPTAAGSGLFIVFADLTSGDETYGAGRFLYISAPDSNNNVILDFNKSYNPPCAFTKYATCPIPTENNKIKVRILAGEKNFTQSH